MHFHSQLEDVIQTLTLSLRLGSVITPDVTAGGTRISIHQYHMEGGCYHSHSVPPDKNRVCVRVLVHGCLQTTGEVLFEGGVFNNGNLQSIEEPEHALSFTAGNTLDLLNVADLETSIRALLPLHQQSDQNRPLRMSVDAAPSTMLKGSQE